MSSVAPVATSAVIAPGCRLCDFFQSRVNPTRWKPDGNCGARSREDNKANHDKNDHPVHDTSLRIGGYRVVSRSGQSMAPPREKRAAAAIKHAASVFQIHQPAIRATDIAGQDVAQCLQNGWQGPIQSQKSDDRHQAVNQKALKHPHFESPSSLRRASRAVKQICETVL